MVVGADDYGIAPATSAAIRALIAQGRLTATSCMVGFPEWPDEAAALRPLADRADVGLHLTLTDHVPLGPMPRTAPDGRLPGFGALARRAWCGRLDLPEIHAEVDRQLQRFVDVFGRPPDYVDGHHHVHQLPGVRELVVAAVLRRAPDAVIRTCVESPTIVVRRGVAVGRALAFAAAGVGLRRAARMVGLATTPGFSGVHPFDPAVDYGRLFARFVMHARSGTFVMCHPGAADATLRTRDGLVDGRELERAFLASDRCAAVLAAAGVEPVRLRR